MESNQKTSSSTTNELTNSEQEAIIRHTETIRDPDIDSEKSNPYTSESDLENNINLPSDSAEDDSRDPPSELLRATVEPLQANSLNLEISAIGTAENVSSKGLTAFNKRLYFVQTHQDIGYNIHIVPRSHDLDKPSSREIFILQLFFDPTSNRIILVNMTKESRIHIQGLVSSRQHVGSTRSAEPIGLKHFQRVLLNVGSWVISLGDRHQINLTVIPRRYASVTPKAWKGAKGPGKRVLELSQPSISLPKKLKKEHRDVDSNALAAFCPAPTREPDHSRSALVDNSSRGIVSEIQHSLEELHLGDAIKVTGTPEEYTLTRNATIANKDSTLIFNAHHSSFPGRVVTVKVCRALKSSDEEIRLRQMTMTAQNWVKEAKIHLKVGEHFAVPQLYEIDGRFLSLYMEHVDCPDLASYREGTTNPLCTLNICDARRILRDISNALQYIHGKNIHHNDIKPCNILYSTSRGAVLIDFGVSTDDGSVHCGGTQWYIPPEYATAGWRGAPGDVFAFGVVMLFVLRRIPLPELQTPYLTWIIADLRKKGPGSTLARKIMERWINIVHKASRELDLISDELDVYDLVVNMVEIDVSRRLTVDLIVEVLEC